MAEIFSFKIVILLILSGAGISFSEEIKMEASTGIFMEPVENPFFYDTTVAMWFKFPFPVWERTNIILNETKCNSSAWFKGSSCPTTFYLPEVQNRFASFIQNSQPFKLISSLSKPSSKIPLDSNCRKIEDRYETEDNTPISALDLSEYISSYQNCSPSLQSGLKFVRTIPDYAYDVQLAYLNMWSGYRKEVWAKLPADRIDGGMWSNAVSAFNALIFSNFQMEINRWKFAVDECSNGKIPGLVHPHDFADVLHEVHATLEDSVYKPVIPKGCGISCHNFKGLSSCIFSKTELAVRVLVPVTARVSRNLSLTKVTNAVFSLNGTHTCKLPQDNNAMALTIVDRDNNIAYNSDCLPRQLCHISSQLVTENIHVCASATLQDGMSVTEFVSQCPLQCRKSASFLNYFPIVTRITKNSFMISGTQSESDLDIIIKCVEKQESFMRHVSMGSLLIKLPCGCAIFSGNVEQNQNGLTSTLCSMQDESNLDLNMTKLVTLTHVIPAHWIDHLIDQELFENLTIANLAFLELNQLNEPDDISNFHAVNIVTNDDKEPELTEPDQDDDDAVKTENNCEKPNQDTITSFRVTDLIFSLCVLLSTLLTLFLVYQLRRLSEKVRHLEQSGENNPILCHEFNGVHKHKGTGSNIPENEYEYEDAEYAPIF